MIWIEMVEFSENRVEDKIHSATRGLRHANPSTFFLIRAFV